MDVCQFCICPLKRIEALLSYLFQLAHASLSGLYGPLEFREALLRTLAQFLQSRVGFLERVKPLLCYKF